MFIWLIFYKINKKAKPLLISNWKSCIIEIFSTIFVVVDC